MKIVLFTDLHFGVRNGSMTWFRSQKDFIYNQLIPYIKELQKDDEVALICLGDVFDSRSSVPTIIGHEVRRMFTDLGKLVEGLHDYCPVPRFYIIQGNHDNGSPVDRNYNTLELVLGGIDCIRIVSQMEPLVLPDLDEACVLLPWFDQEKETPEEFTKRYKGHYIFTHADIIMGNPKLHTPVFSGHVHTPYINGNVRNLGSCFPLTFADANSARYFYVWDPSNDNLKRIANERSIRFWRVYNEDIMEFDWSKCNSNDYIECYIRYSLLQDPDYQDKCKSLQLQFKNYRTIPLPDEMVNTGTQIECDIEGIIEQMIPEHLTETFTHIKSKINECSES